MRKVILMIALAIVSSNAMAGWVSILKSKDGYFYADSDSIQKNGNLVSMWAMADYKIPKIIQTWKAYKSSKEQDEYDCDGGRVRKLASEAYPENMGMGKLIRRDTAPVEWTPVASGSITELMWKFACGKN